MIEQRPKPFAEGDADLYTELHAFAESLLAWLDEHAGWLEGESEKFCRENFLFVASDYKDRALEIRTRAQELEELVRLAAVGATADVDESLETNTANTEKPVVQVGQKYRCAGAITISGCNLITDAIYTVIDCTKDTVFLFSSDSEYAWKKGHFVSVTYLALRNHIALGDLVLVEDTQLTSAETNNSSNAEEPVIEVGQYYRDIGGVFYLAVRHNVLWKVQWVGKAFARLVAVKREPDGSDLTATAVMQEPSIKLLRRWIREGRLQLATDVPPIPKRGTYVQISGDTVYRITAVRTRHGPPAVLMRRVIGFPWFAPIFSPRYAADPPHRVPLLDFFDACKSGKFIVITKEAANQLTRKSKQEATV